MSLTSEYDGGLEHRDSPDTDHAGQEHDQHDGNGHADHYLWEQVETAEVEIALRGFEECRGHRDPDAVADRADYQRLQQDHTRDSPVRDPNGLERTELLQVLQNEQVKGLSGDHGAYDEG